MRIPRNAPVHGIRWVRSVSIVRWSRRDFARLFAGIIDIGARAPPRRALRAPAASTHASCREPPNVTSSVTLLVPTLNEIDGMRAIMPQIDPAWCDQVLVVDGGSTDGTQEYARARGYDVIVQRQRGIRYAYQEA